MSSNESLGGSFWEASEIIHTDNLQNRKTITGEYKINFLYRLNKDLRKKGLDDKSGAYMILRWRIKSLLVGKHVFHSKSYKFIDPSSYNISHTPTTLRKSFSGINTARFPSDIRAFKILY